MFFEDDNQWSAMRSAQQARHGAAIAYVRRQVEPGTEYVNEVARAVLSDKGAYFELRELPEEFVGGVGDEVSHRMLDASEAQELLMMLRGLVQEASRGKFRAQTLSLYVLYAGGSLRARQGLFVYDHGSNGTSSLLHGAWQPELPRVFKLRLHLPSGQKPPSGLPASGIVFFVAPTHTDGGQCLLVTLPRTPDTRDLSGLPDATPGRWKN